MDSTRKRTRTRKETRKKREKKIRIKKKIKIEKKRKKEAKIRRKKTIAKSDLKNASIETKVAKTKTNIAIDIAIKNRKVTKRQNQQSLNKRRKKMDNHL